MRFEIRDHKKKRLLGTAYLENEKVVLTGALATFQGRVLLSEDLIPITQDDGAAWINALSREFRTPYVVAGFTTGGEENGS